MTDTVKLDLDAILPQQGQITLSGKDYAVEQPSLEDLVFLTRVINGLEGTQTNTNVADTLQDLHDYLPKLIPDFEAKLTLQQAMALIRYFFELSTPPEAQAMAAQGMEPSAEKKTTDTANS